MGYQLSSFLAVSPSDKHRYFLYFIPARKYRDPSKIWINEYFEDAFSSIARAIGPTGVVVTPTEGGAEEYVESIAGIRSGGCLFSQHQLFSEPSDRLPDYLHNGQPYLILSAQPVLPESKCEGMILNLDSVPDKATLGKIIHAIIDSIKGEKIEILREALPEWDRSYDQKKLDSFTRMLELKPNLFGIGINLKEVVSFINNKFNEKAARKK